jgi:DNA topoisomerase-1
MPRAHVVPFNTPSDSLEAARSAGLRYTTDSEAGIRRVRQGKGFRYVGPDGKSATPEDVQRIRSLVIPPAWTSVWICANPRGHLQVTGRDARGRKQYRYHSKWRGVRDETKFHRLIGFARALPGIRRRTAAHLRRAGLSREKVLATVVSLLQKTLIRVGNDEYARENQSFGLTTLRDGHVKVNGARVRFVFRGKSRVEHEVDLIDARLARIVRQCRDIPGYDLFQYYDERGERHAIGSADVNAYLKEIAGEEFTSKDFRTWAGTVLALKVLRQFDACESDTQVKKNIVRAVEEVAGQLRNTAAVCRKCYIHPTVLEVYAEGTLGGAPKAGARRRAGLDEAEAAVLALLSRKAGRDLKRAG